MAGQKFEYDESGSTFFYFLISVLGLILVPCTFYFFPADAVEDPVASKTKGKCRCSECLKKEERLRDKQSSWKGTKKALQRVGIILGWALMAALIYKVQQFDYEYANFDPYDILGVSMQASSAEIKKAYRKQSLIYHPDKTTGDERKFMKLNKAYQALTDPVARRNYEQYGNPDGPGAMHFGIALPSWIVEKENSLVVLGLYALVFMFGMPTVVAIWWYRSSKFSADQVLLDTTQLYYYFFHKTPSMPYKRALMVLSASFEFEKGHNSAITERESDNFEVPPLFKQLPHLGEKNKERPLCFPYSVKARALLHAHLSRIPLNPNTLDIDRLYLLHCCPTLIQEMVTCVAQLIMLAHAGRISRLPTLDTIESTMKLSPTLVQGLWDTKNPLLQLPHFTESTLRSCVVRGRTLRSVQQLVALLPQDRRHVLRSFTADEQNDIVQVCNTFPHVTMTVKSEVVDDDDSGVFTAGAIVTITVHLVRKNSGDVFNLTNEEDDEKAAARKRKAQEDEEKRKEVQDLSPTAALATLAVIDKKKTKWNKDMKKKSGKGGEKAKENHPKVKANGKAGGSKREESAKDNAMEPKDHVKESKDHVKESKDHVKESKDHVKESKDHAKESKDKHDKKERRADEAADESDEDYSNSHSDESEAGDADTESHREEKSMEDEDAEWERFQKGLTKREKVLEGKSKISHSVHCPFFPDDKQEYWWVYVCDRKNKKLVTVPYHLTNLVEEEEVQLKMTAPHRQGVYTYQVCVKSDSYLGLELQKDIRMDVKAAREVPTQHPQWQECSSDDDSQDDGDDSDREKDDGEESEFTTDEEMSDNEGEETESQED
ncbi:translocation protein SEC63 homolog isoform X2 [Hyalella azteca]|uniref:Translocation protein SEC63 homolog isoform X2 n=1 Tax=Hyalella azteca TaxID=294128 RepID=A0A8B7PEZ9_HYAAZ|nr:translocation protein SEC63 homolog isoform X2 [Hyalella azteca]